MGYADYQQSNQPLRRFYSIINRPLVAVHEGPVNPATYITVGPFQDKANFVAGADHDVYLEMKMPYQPLVEDQLEIHLHYAMNGGNPGTIDLELEYYIADDTTPDIWLVLPTIVTHTITINVTPGVEIDNTFNEVGYALKIPVASLAPHAFVGAILRRMGTTDTCPDDMILMHVEPRLVKT